jgi:hypothetical protein
MTIIMPSGKQLEAQGEFTGLVDVGGGYGPKIELDKLDEHGQKEILLPDPRAQIVSAIAPEFWDRKASEAEWKDAHAAGLLPDKVLYNPRDHIDELAPEMRQWLIEHPAWPQSTPSYESESKAGPFEEWAPRDDPPLEGETLMITYEGDIREKLRACGTRTPFRLNADGDTEQLVEGHFNPDAIALGDPDQIRMTADELDEAKRFTEQELLRDAAQNGRIKSSRWIDLPKPTKTAKPPKPDADEMRERADAFDDPYSGLPEIENDSVTPLGMATRTEFLVRLLERIRIQVMSQPLTKQCYDAALFGGYRRTRPEHAIGEKLNAQMQCALAARFGLEKWQKTDDDIDLLRACEAAGVLRLLKNAQVYLWSEQTQKLAEAAPMPTHVISTHTLPNPIMFWSHENRHWLLIAHQPKGIFAATTENENEEGAPTAICSFIPYGSVWPHDFRGDKVPVEGLGRVLKRCSFLNSPYVTNEKRKVSRHIRRQMERADQEPPDDDVSIVILRRMQVRKSQQTSGDHPGVEWKHHWWVSSFNRAQWYPSEQAHRVIWIESFLKGDLSKPLLEKIYAVKR